MTTSEFPPERSMDPDARQLFDYYKRSDDAHTMLTLAHELRANEMHVSAIGYLLPAVIAPQEYIREVLAGAYPNPRRTLEIHTATARRLERNRLLWRRAPDELRRIVVVVGDAAIRTASHYPGVLTGIRDLIETRENQLEVYVARGDAPIHPLLGCAFTVYSNGPFNSGLVVVNQSESSVMTEPEDVRMHRDAVEHVINTSVVLTRDASFAFIGHVDKHGLDTP